MEKTGKLYIVATPIGNLKDITLRALEILKKVDAVICEEYRRGITLLKRLDIQKDEIITLNEHDEINNSHVVLMRLLKGENFALISDCGTPGFADPGSYLIKQCTESGIPVIPIPGPSSLMAALSILDCKLDKFHFAGFLPRDSKERFAHLSRLKKMKIPIVIMDTPYRLTTILDLVEMVFGKNQHITLACNLTHKNEVVYRDAVGLVRKHLRTKKAEFVLLIH